MTIDQARAHLVSIIDIAHLAIAECEAIGDLERADVLRLDVVAAGELLDRLSAAARRRSATASLSLDEVRRLEAVVRAHVERTPTTSIDTAG
jgi:hypothetical protein